MPKLRRLLSVILAVWLCVMLVAFTYTWVSRNWTPSIKSDDINIASAGALVISVLGNDKETELFLNDIVGVDTSFTFRQVSSQDGINFFWKDFSPQVDDEDAAALFWRVGGEEDTHKKDYIDTKFCLQLDETMPQAKYIFIHPETKITYEGSSGKDVNKAIRIALTFRNDNGGESTVILADLGDGLGVKGSMLTDTYQAVANLNGDMFSEKTVGALGYQTVYDLHYFDCGRETFDYSQEAKLSDVNYLFDRVGKRTLFTMQPGDKVWVNMRIWLEGQDDNCVTEIAGEQFNFLLKFDSAFVKAEE